MLMLGWTLMRIRGKVYCVPEGAGCRKTHTHTQPVTMYFGQGLSNIEKKEELIWAPWSEKYYHQ